MNDTARLRHLELDQINLGDLYVTADDTLMPIALIDKGAFGVTFVFEDGSSEYVRTDIPGHPVSNFQIYR